MALSLETKLIAGALAVLALLAGVVWMVRDLEAKGAQQAASRVSEATIAQQKEDAAMGARRVQNLSDALNDAKLQSDHSRAVAAAAARDRDAFGMQLRAYAAAHRRPADPAASGPVPDLEGGDPLGVLADVSARADARAELYAQVAEDRRIIAEGCERAYDGLSVKP